MGDLVSCACEVIMLSRTQPVSDVTTGATAFSAERTSGEGEVWGEGVKCAGVVVLSKET